MIKELLQEMFILKEKGYYKQAIEILYKLLEMVESEDETVEILYEFLGVRHGVGRHVSDFICELEVFSWFET